MMCSAFFGMLSEKRKQNWDNKDTQPYDVLDKPICLERKGHDLLNKGEEYFTDRIKIDWGSFAWKCTPEQIIQFLISHKSTLPWLVESEEETINKVKSYIEIYGDTEYGVVFVEEY